MSPTANDTVSRLKSLFPHSDDQILWALIGHWDAVVAYLSQVHEVTRSEAAETLELLGFAHVAAAPVAVAAE